MVLTCFCGRAGTGKTKAVARRIQKAVAQGQKAYLIVPDQFTLEAEKELLGYLQAPGLWEAEVLSFSRLADRVLALYPPPYPPLDKRGCAMAVSRVLMEQQPSLVHYARYAGSARFAATLAGEIAEYKRFGITPEALSHSSEDRPHLLEIAGLYRAYQDYLHERYLDTEDRMDLCIASLGQSGLLKNALVCIDGFEMLTNQVYRLLEQILLNAGETIVTFRLGKEDEADAPLFETERKHWERVVSLARQHRIPTAQQRFAPPRLGQGRYQAPELAYLEKQLFTTEKTPFSGPAPHLTLAQGASPFQEASFCAQQVFELVQEKGLRYHEIAVLAPDMSFYGPLLQRALAPYDIPLFWDIKRQLASFPAARFVLHALYILQHKRYARDVLSWLKTGFTRLSQPEMEQWERWIAQYGLYTLPAQPPQGMPEEEQAYYLAAFDTLFSPLLSFGEALKTSDSARAQAMALQRYLEEDGFVSRLEQFIQETYLTDPEACEQAQQFFSLLTALLTQFIQVLGETTLDPGAFALLLSAGLSAEEIGLLPYHSDAVQAGSLPRSKMGEIKALFVLGLAAGQVPAGVPETGLLSHNDRTLLETNGLWMGHTALERASEEELSLYSVFSKPGEFLFLSYAQTDLNGKPCLPSPYLTRLQALFPHANYPSLPATPPPSLLQASLFGLSQAVRRVYEGEKADPAWAVAYRAAERLAPDAITRMQRALAPDSDDIGPALSQALFSKDGVYATNITGLETLARCPFRHFMERGLALKRLEAFGKTPIDEGNFYHAVLQQYVELFGSQPLESEEVAEKIAALCQQLEQQAFLSGPYQSDGRAKWQAQKQRRSLQRAANIIALQAAKGAFLPRRTEQPCFVEVSLPDGARAVAKGIIDRIDAKLSGGETYLRVVDYKASLPKDATLTGFATGASLQLPLYLDAACREEQGLPAAMVMAPVRTAVKPFPAADNPLSGHALYGYYTEEGREPKDILRQHTSRLLTQQQMQHVLEQAKTAAQGLFMTLRSGATSPLPLSGSLDGCQYCAYARTCRYVPGVSPTRQVDAGALPKKEEAPHD